jgi:hypothetical protein
VDINIKKEEDGFLINIHGTRNQKITLQQSIIRDQQPLQNGKVTTTIHGIKGKKNMQKIATKD